jgi:hypothetical protein
MDWRKCSALEYRCWTVEAENLRSPKDILGKFEKENPHPIRTQQKSSAVKLS